MKKNFSWADALFGCNNAKHAQGAIYHNVINAHND